MNDEVLLPVILAGGVGTRLWPLSRIHHGKPFLELTGGGTLLLQTLQRVSKATDAAPIIVCGEEERFLAAEELRKWGSDGRILLEAAARSTAPALTLAALEASRDGADPILLVVPSDHTMDTDAFARAAHVASRHAAEGSIVVMAVTPTAGLSGYGYLQLGDAVDGGGAHRVSHFIEKPDKATAEALVASGKVSWNAGIFVVRASRWLAEVKRHAPDIATSCHTAFSGRQADHGFVRVDGATFAQSPAISIDYAVMEKTDDLLAVPLDAGWSDLGTFDSLADWRSQDSLGNAVSGDVVARDSSGNFLHAENRLLTVIGLHDTVVVETADAVFVAPRASADSAGEIAKVLAASDRNEAAYHTRVHRPWGHYVTIENRPDHVIKRITVNPGKSLSLQRHRYRSEHWMVMSGIASVDLDGQSHSLLAQQSIDISVGAVHALANETEEPLIVIEVQMGEQLDESDIERLEDRYGRA